MLKGGDFRSREADVYRCAEVSNQVIDQMTAAGLPFAREYSGVLTTRSFGGVQVSRTFYSSGQTGQQCLLAGYTAMARQISKKKITMYSRREMLELVLVNGKSRGIITRNLITGDNRKTFGTCCSACYWRIRNDSTLFVNTGNQLQRICSISCNLKKAPDGLIHVLFRYTPSCIPQLNPYQGKLHTDERIA